MITDKLVKRQRSDFEYRIETDLDLEDATPEFRLVDKATGQGINANSFCYIKKNGLRIYIPNQIRLPSNSYRYSLAIRNKKGKTIQIAVGDFIIV